MAAGVVQGVRDLRTRRRQLSNLDAVALEELDPCLKDAKCKLKCGPLTVVVDPNLNRLLSDSIRPLSVPAHAEASL